MTIGEVSSYCRDGSSVIVSVSRAMTNVPPAAGAAVAVAWPAGAAVGVGCSPAGATVGVTSAPPRQAASKLPVASSPPPIAPRWRRWRRAILIFSADAIVRDDSSRGNMIACLLLEHSPAPGAGQRRRQT